MKKKKLERLLKEQMEQMDRHSALLKSMVSANQASKEGEVRKPDENNDYLSYMTEESNRNATLEETKQSEGYNMLKKELERCKKECEKGRKARKRAEKHQKETTRRLKELQNQQRDMMKEFQKVQKYTERGYGKLKDSIKQTAQKEKKDVKLVRNILGIVASWGNISDSGASLKELASDYKAFNKRCRKRNAGISCYNNDVIDVLYHENNRK